MNYYNLQYCGVPTTSRQASDVATQIFHKLNYKYSSLDSFYNKSNDELWVESWLQQNNVYQPIPKLRRINVPSNAITIHQAKNYLSTCICLLGKLDKLQQELEENASTMSTVTWKERTNEIGLIKDDFTKIMCKFENVEIMKHLKSSLKKRNKRRVREKHKRQYKIEKNREEMENRKKLHKEIDQWLSNKKEEVERVKIEELMQKDADIVLAEVTKKKSDARKHLSLISSLIKLRTVRENFAIQRRESIFPADKKAFNITTEKLIKMWESCMAKYRAEEQELKLVLEKNQNEDSRQAKLTKERNLIDEWTKVLFGSQQLRANEPFSELTAAERQFETFVAIRKSWDTFLTSHDNENGSKIPIGWILPDVNPNQQWSRYLEHTNFNA